MARKMPRRNRKGQFVKGGRKSAPKRRKRSRRNPPRKRAPARRRRKAPRDPRSGRTVRRRRRTSRKNPKALNEILIAGVVVGGLDVLAGMFLAPKYPKITMWGMPIAKGLGGYYLRTKTKMKDAGTVLLGSAAAELTVLAVGWITGAMTPAPPPINGESAAWFRLNGNFPRGNLSHPMSTPNKLGGYLANRRITDPLPTSGIPNLATAM